MPVVDFDNYPTSVINLVAYQGATFKHGFTYTTAAGAAVDITGATGTMKARKITPARLGVAAVVGSAVFTVSVGSGIVLTLPGAGMFTVTITAAVLAAIAPDTYDYDLELTLASGDTVKPVYGIFDLRREISF